MGSKAGRRRTKYSVASLLLALLVGVGAWWTQQDGASTPVSVAEQDGQKAVDSAGLADARVLLEQLHVAEEDTGYRYDRDDWPHWASQGQGCNTREVALREQGQNVRVDDECRAVEGTWRSDYDGVVVQNASDADLDHLVPLAEAARSGARGWTREQRRDFANDLDQLIVVTATSNRQKGDQDPASWLPERGRCGYVTRWIQVKTSYRLSVDPDEYQSLAAVLSRC
ncbi:HNH endonuclease family protein [Saccharomonospora sp. NPDC006951]